LILSARFATADHRRSIARMRSHIRRACPSSALPLLFVAVAACGDDGGISDDRFPDTDSTTSGDTSDAPPDGADETGGSVPTAVEGRCLYDPDLTANLYGYRYQCEGSVAVDIVIEHDFDGSPEVGFFELPFGHGVEGDSYEAPLVMACCPWYDTSPGATNCDQPHERACLVDLVEQGCKSMVAKIEDHAHERFPGLLDTAKRQAVLKVAEHVRTHQGDCTAAFREDTGIAATQPTCDEEGNGVPYVSMLENGVWMFDPDGAVKNVEIAVAQAQWTGLYPNPVDDPYGAASCESADENDGVLFLEIDPAAGTKVLHLVAGGVELVGAGVAGVGEIDSTSTLALASEPGAASLEDFALHSAGAAAVLVGDVTVPVDDFHVRLWGRAPAVVEGSTLTVQPSGARFAVSATVLGESRVNTATNATPIVVTKEAGGWRTSAFSIESPHVGEPWLLVVAPGRWQ
jgi:hypothetical protein